MRNIILRKLMGYGMKMTGSIKMVIMVSTTGIIKNLAKLHQMLKILKHQNLLALDSFSRLHHILVIQN